MHVVPWKDTSKKLANGDVLQDEFAALIIMGFNFNRGTRMGHIFLGLGGREGKKILVSRGF